MNTESPKDPSSQPKYWVSYTCAGCGLYQSFEFGPDPYPSGTSNGLVHISATHPKPDGWIEVSSRFYCPKHKIEIVTNIRIDEVVTETVRNWRTRE